jgi:Na+/H+-translocating membrane pyrophosphatase
MNQPTFNQKGALTIAILCILLLAAIYFVPSKGSEQGLIIGALISILTGSVGFLIGSSAGSQAKDAKGVDQTNQLISALANSTPVVPCDTPEPAKN